MFKILYITPYLCTAISSKMDSSCFIAFSQSSPSLYLGIVNSRSLNTVLFTVEDKFPVSAVTAQRVL